MFFYDQSNYFQHQSFDTVIIFFVLKAVDFFLYISKRFFFFDYIIYIDQKVWERVNVKEKKNILHNETADKMDYNLSSE